MADCSTWMVADVDIKPAYQGEWTTDLSERAKFWLPKVLGRAATVAPCFKDPTQLPPEVQEAAKGIIIGAVLRLVDPRQGNTQYQTAGPFALNTDTKLRSDRLLSIPDRDELVQLCRSVSRRRRGGTIRTPVGY